VENTVGVICGWSDVSAEPKRWLILPISESLYIVVAVFNEKEPLKLEESQKDIPLCRLKYVTIVRALNGGV
jgi:hypothetical protein